MIILTIECEEAVGETFNCRPGRETSINEFAKMVLSTGNNLEVERSDGRLGDIRRSCADMKKAGKVLGFKPKISLEEGLKELFNGKASSK